MNNIQKIALEPEVKNALHPFWLFSNELDKETCKKIISFGEKNWVTARVGKSLEINKKIRITDIAWCNEQWLFDIAWQYVNVANKNSNWNFQIDSCESMQITRYRKGGHYKFHPDGNGFTKEISNNKFTNGKTRKLSMTIVLSEDYEGGEFEFFGDNQLIKEKIGTVIVFPSYIVHKVRPVTKGTRYSLVVWFCGEPFR